MKRLLLGCLLALSLTVPLAAWPWSTYALTVRGGTGSGTYRGGTQLTLTAASPCAGQIAWLSAGPDLVWGNTPQDFSQPNQPVTQFTMPKHATWVQVTCSTSSP